MNLSPCFNGRFAGPMTESSAKVFHPSPDIEPDIEPVTLLGFGGLGRAFCLRWGAGTD